MSIKLFSDFLIEKKKLTKEQFQEVVEYQKKNDISLSKIALDEGYLTKEDLKLINEKQQVYDRKFSNTVLDLMLLSTNQLEQLLKRYDENHISFYDALIHKELITKDELENELKSYEANQKEVSKHIFKEIAFFDRDNLLQETVSVLEKLYLRTTSESTIKLKKIDFSSACNLDEKMVLQGLCGDESLEFAFASDDIVHIEFAKAVLKDPLVDDEENEIDTIGKFLNVLLVNIAVSLISRGVYVELSDSAISTSNKFDIENFCRLVFLTSQGEISLYIKL